jgi:nicotinamide phosphoribosyltransferase
MNRSNLAVLTDSYKHSHWAQLPPGVTGLSAYLESRAGARYPWSRFFGLQGLLKRYFAHPLTHDDVREAQALVDAHMGPGIFNTAGWARIVTERRGRLPLEISAVPEGTDVPTGNVLMQVVNTDPRLAWLVTFVETALQQVWAPTTVATLSGHARERILRDLETSAEDPASVLPFRLHDFGLRGVSSMEGGAILGAAHLTSFLGTDTMPALVEAAEMYGVTGAAGFSIAAGEHSEILAWGPDGEADYFAHLFARFLKPGTIVAAPIDTYDMARCLDGIISTRFRETIVNSGGTYVARPDSGDPAVVVPYVIATLASAFGSTRNAKGYQVLHPSVRVIFGDGMTLDSIASTNAAVLAAGWSIENVAYGMGGGLLQKIDRDTQRFALKVSAVERNGTWMNVAKTIASDPSKASKAGRLALVRAPGTASGWTTVTLEQLAGRRNELRPVWRNGELLVDETFDVIRARVAGEAATL